MVIGEVIRVDHNSIYQFSPKATSVISYLCFDVQQKKEKNTITDGRVGAFFTEAPK